MNIEKEIEIIKNESIIMKLEMHEAKILLRALTNIDLAKTPRDMDYELEQIIIQLGKAINSTEYDIDGYK